MSQKIFRKFIDFQIQNNILDENKLNIYEYAYKQLIYRLIVYALIGILGIILRSLNEIICFLLAFIPLRQYSGGLHFEDKKKCILISGILVCTSGKYLKCFPTPNIFTLFLWGLANASIFLLAPVECRDKKLDELEKRVYKKRACRILKLENLFLVITFITQHMYIVKSIMYSQISLGVYLWIGIVKNWREKQKLNEVSKSPL